MYVLLPRDYRCYPLPVLADVDAEAPVNNLVYLTVDDTVNAVADAVVDTPDPFEILDVSEIYRP
jgi:hypothetical protein